MKNWTLIILFLLFYSSCTKDNIPDVQEVELIGTWKLVALLLSPTHTGGNGTFQNVSSSKTITFNQDGSITSNGVICNNSIDSKSPSSGTYNTNASTITTSGCNSPIVEFSFDTENAELIIHIPCFEPCQAKYKKQ